MTAPIRFVLEITTDAFLGGADCRGTEVADGLRAPSVRGALHFAWRALQGALSIDELRQRERVLFGSIDTGQRLRVRPGARFARKIPRGRSPYGKGGAVGALPYLGYGALHFSGRLEREALEAGAWTEFDLLTSQRSLDDRERRELTRALWLLGALFGLGSRSRRGWGSLQIAAWERPQRPEPPAPWPAECESPQQLQDAWRTFWEAVSDQLPAGGWEARPDWTVLSRKSRIFVWNRTFPTWSAALKELGEKLRRFRQYYGAQRPNQGPVGADHDLVYELYNGHTVQRSPARAAFGLPHNYYLSTVKENVGVNARAHGETLDRRASPLFLHVTRLKTGEFVPVVGYLPSRFLPNGARIRMAGKRSRRTANVPPPSDAAIQHFLDGGPVEGYHERNGRPIDAHWDGLKQHATEISPPPAAARR